MQLKIFSKFPSPTLLFPSCSTVVSQICIGVVVKKSWHFERLVVLWLMRCDKEDQRQMTKNVICHLDLESSLLEVQNRVKQISLSRRRLLQTNPLQTATINVVSITSRLEKNRRRKVMRCSSVLDDYLSRFGSCIDTVLFMKMLESKTKNEKCGCVICKKIVHPSSGIFV
jgi:hypothetical protein